MPKLALFKSVLLASVFVSNVGLTANAQTKAPSIESGVFLIEGFGFSLYSTPPDVGGRYWSINYPNYDKHRVFDHDVEFPESKLSVVYHNLEGFRGLFSYEGKSGEIITDVLVDVSFGTQLENGEIGPYVKGYIGKDTNNFVFGDDDFGHIEFEGYPGTFKPGYLTGNGVYVYPHQTFITKNITFSNGESEFAGNLADPVDLSFSSDNTNLPIKGYPQLAYHPNYISGSVVGNIGNGDNLDNHLVGVFVASASGSALHEIVFPDSLSDSDENLIRQTRIFVENQRKQSAPVVEAKRKELPPVVEAKRKELPPVVEAKRKELATVPKAKIKKPASFEEFLIEHRKKITSSLFDGYRDMDYAGSEIPKELLKKDTTKGLKVIYPSRRKYGLSRENHAALIRHANPTFQWWGVEPGRRRSLFGAFRDNRPKESVETECKSLQVCADEKSSLIYSAQFDNYFENLGGTSEEKKIWKKEVTTAIGKGYLHWLHRLPEISPGHLDVHIDDNKDGNYNVYRNIDLNKNLGVSVIVGEAVSLAIETYKIAGKFSGPVGWAAGLAVGETAGFLVNKPLTENRAVFSEQWLDDLHDKYTSAFFSTDPNQKEEIKEEVRQALINGAIALSAIELSPYLSEKVLDTDSKKTFLMHNSIDIYASYGVWLDHEFKLEGQGTDIISARPYFTGFAGDIFENHPIPTVSAIYRGKDNFLGVDMSAHFLGAPLQADARVNYTFARNGSTAKVNIDNFEVFTGENFSKGNAFEKMIDANWRPRTGAIEYKLECDSNSCYTNDKITANIFFSEDGLRVGGEIVDKYNQYVGGFAAIK